VLALDPRVILLDEPLSQLDVAGGKQLLAELDRLRAQGRTIVMVEHRLADLKGRVDQVLLLDGGRLAFSGPAASPDLSAAFRAAGLEAPWSDGAPKQGQVVSQAAIDRNRAQAVVLRTVGLGFQYPRADRALFHELSLELRRGERVALVGPNGSGKSTLFGLLAGLLRPTQGRVEFPADGTGGHPLGLVLQQPDLMLFSSTVRDELAFAPRQQKLNRDEISARVERIGRRLDLTELFNEAPQALSQGQRLRVAVAATLTLEPQVLLLDEPTMGLDRRQIERLMQAIDPWQSDSGQPRHAVLFSTHDLRTAYRYADRVLSLEHGQLTESTPRIPVN
jgi:energy-coupling factor transport system ATP-binding protein